jgi:hypothetical protein
MNRIEVLKHFKNLIECEQFVLGGSTVLLLNGLTSKDSKDLDISITKPSESSLELLKKLARESSSPTNPPGVNDENYKAKVISILFNGYKLDFFPYYPPSSSENVPCTLTYEGIDVATIGYIIEKKRGYGRDKDFLQLKSLAGKFHDEELFNKYVKTRM